MVTGAHQVEIKLNWNSYDGVQTCQDFTETEKVQGQFWRSDKVEIPFSDLCEIYGPCPTHYICQHAPFYAKDAIECVCDPNNPNPMDPNCVRKFLRKHQSKRHHAFNIYSNIILAISYGS